MSHRGPTSYSALTTLVRQPFPGILSGAADQLNGVHPVEGSCLVAGAKVLSQDLYRCKVTATQPDPGGDMRRRHTLVAVGCSALLAVTVPSGVAVADSYWGGMGAAAPMPPQ